jgi:hypothetical protein
MAKTVEEAALNVLFGQAVTSDDGFRQWFYPKLPRSYEINPQIVKKIAELAKTHEDPHEVARLVRENQVHSPS